MNKDKKPLSETHPELAKEAYGWDPLNITSGSSKKLSWQCNKQHNWLDTPNHRTQRNSGCPYCINRKLLIGFNDLATTNPDIAKEADGWDPTTVVAGSNKVMNWKCSKGHKWKSKPNDRTGRGSNCGTCSNNKLLVGFNDLATTHPEIAREADGWDPSTVIAGTHEKKQWKCSKGHTWVAIVKSRSYGSKSNCPDCSNKRVSVGFNDLATTHPEIAREADGWDPLTVVAGSGKKVQWKCNLGHQWKTSVQHRTINHSGCPYCGGAKVLAGFNDLATTHPEIAREADGWDPKSFTAGSGKKVQWKCNLGHLYLSRIGSRTHQEQNCPICSNNQMLVGFNDLATTHPEIAREADGWDPSTVIAGTHEKKQWKCSKGHTWVAIVKSRSYGSKSNCPGCSITGFDPNQIGYLYFLIQPKWEIFQIGITNVPEDRLNRHKRNGFELLELRGPMDGHTAQELETAILRYLKSQKADLSPEHVAGKFDGYSESWTIDSYKVNNLKELMDKASEAGF